MVVSSPQGQFHAFALVEVGMLVLAEVVEEKAPPQGQVQGFPPLSDGVAAVEGEFLNARISALDSFLFKDERLTEW